MLDDTELLLARLAVNFRFVTQAQIDEVIAEADAQKKPVATILLERNLCTEPKLAMLRSIQGASPGQLVVQEKRETVSRHLFCAYCDNEATIADFEEKQTYQCDRCGAVLQKERPTKRVAARDRDRSPLGPRPVETTPPKPIKAPVAKTALFCPVCDAEDEVEGYSPEKAVPCRECGATMVAASSTASSEESDEIPMLQTLGLGGEIEMKSVSVEKAERNAQQKRNVLRLQRAREQLRLGDPTLAFQDLTMLCQDEAAPPEAHLLKAEIGVQLGELDAAGAACDALVKQKAFLANAYTLQGQIQFARENYRKAMSELEMALEEGGSNVLAVLLHGACQQRLHKLTGARQSFERAILMAQGKEASLSPEIQAMLRQAATFIQTGKLEKFGPDVKDASSSTEIRHTREAESQLKEDPYVAAREFRRAGSNDKAKELFTSLLAAAELKGRLVDAAKENGFARATDYRDLVCHEALAEIAKEARDMGLAAVHLTKSGMACLAAGLQADRGAENALAASQIWSQLNNSAEAERSFGVAAQLMSWPNLAIRAWVDELPRENINCTLVVELTNTGKGNARHVRIQTGEYLRFDRELRFPDIAPGETATREAEFKATRRSKELISEFKLFFRDAESDRQLSRGIIFTFDVLPSYETTRHERVYWIGAPQGGDGGGGSASGSDVIAAPEPPRPAARPDAPAMPPPPAGTASVGVASPPPADARATATLEMRLVAIEANLEARLVKLEAKLDRLIALVE